MAKKKKQTREVSMPNSPEAQIRTRARDLEIGTCYISSDWEEIREATILVSRGHKQGGTTFGIFLVDLAMKGLTDTFYTFNMPENECRNFLNDYLNKAEHVEIDYVKAHNLIYGAIEYGVENGYSAHKDFSVSQYILEEDNDSVPLIEFDFGFEGKPMLFDEEDDSDSTDTPNVLSIPWPELVRSLPDITEENITEKYLDAEEFNELIESWDINDWKLYFDENRNNISLQFLDYAVTSAWDVHINVLEYDHYEYQFNREWKREETRLPKLDEMNERANEVLELGKFDLIPLIYDNLFTFKELFPESEIVPTISAIEMSRIFCEYFLEKEDFFEAISYYALIQILEWNDYPKEVIQTGKKLIIKAIKHLPKDSED